MSQSEQHYDVHIEHNVPVPMRDGTILRAEVYRPKAEGKWPVIVERHGHDPSSEETVERGKFFSQRGYVFIYNNTRGTYQSKGTFFPFIDDGWGQNQDGYDTIEWAGHQPWSDGNVGMFGSSYGAFTQYQTAPTRPPSLKACVPILGTCSPSTFAFPNGVYHMQRHRFWALYMAWDRAHHYPESLPTKNEARASIRTRLDKALEELERWNRHLPLKDFPPLKELSPWYFEHLKHPAGDPWWIQTDMRTRFSEVDLPIMHVAGWFDPNINAAIECYLGLVEQGRSEKCRSSQRLIIGPWMHEDPPIPPMPLDFTSDAIIDFQETALSWFDYWLRGQDNDIPNEPGIRAFLMGENRWLELDQWPPDNVTYQPIYFRQGTGKTEESLNNGQLTFELPITDEQPDTYTYDPQDPIPGRWPSQHTDEMHQNDVEGRLLTYTSDTLSEPIAIVGPIKAVLYASSSAPDTDWVVRLCDILPDGRSIKVCDGILRARYRNALVREEFMEPGEVYQFEIDLTATAQTFLAGHKIRIQVASSDFPKFDRNLNLGGPFGEESQGQVAINTIYHDATRPSHIILPIMKA